MDVVIAGAAGKTNDQGRAARGEDVTFCFDYKKMTNGTEFTGTTFGLADDWLIDQSPPSPIDFVTDPKSGDPGKQELDYALVRLKADPGNRPIGVKADPDSPKRGWLVPWKGDYDFAANKALFIVQHPNGDPLKLALDTEAAPCLNGNGTGIRCGTNTEGGSSGSPCSAPTGSWSPSTTPGTRTTPRTTGRSTTRGSRFARYSNSSKCESLRMCWANSRFDHQRGRPPR